LPGRQWVSLRIHDVRGRLIRTLLDGVGVAGTHEVMWDGTSDQGQAVAPGIYFCCMTTEHRHLVARIVVLR
jgi:flagellar hook assembly protein FlgD